MNYEEKAVECLWRADRLGGAAFEPGEAVRTTLAEAQVYATLALVEALRGSESGTCGDTVEWSGTVMRCDLPKDHSGNHNQATGINGSWEKFS